MIAQAPAVAGMENRAMDIDLPLQLLGGLTPAAFMRRHWQKQPLLVRQALPGVVPPLSRTALFDLAARDDVESRLVRRLEGADAWSLASGPLARRSLPAVKTPGWTLLVQGLDLHVAAAHELLSRFRFIPDARLDDLMMSWASDGGGVGPHLDSYDVFLIQVQGTRRWRIGRVADRSFVGGVPLKILRHFEPEQEWLLEPGDLLYLPPMWGHDGQAVGECMTCSVGFRAPGAAEFARELMPRLAEGLEPAAGERPYRDPRQPATATPAMVPPGLREFAAQAVERALRSPDAMALALGEVLTEPKPKVWFEPREPYADGRAVVLDAGTRMMYDERFIFINGEAMRAAGRDARLMRELADSRRLAAPDCARLGSQARQLLAGWVDDGWAHLAD